MNVEDEKAKMIFRNDVNGKALYTIGLSHKKQDGTWENGYMSCRFPKDADIQDKTKIIMHNAWIDFYVKDKITHSYIFINKYEIVNDTKTTQKEVEVSQNIKSDYDIENSDIQINDDDLPF